MLQVRSVLETTGSVSWMLAPDKSMLSSNPTRLLINIEQRQIGNLSRQHSTIRNHIDMKSVKGN